MIFIAPHRIAFQTGRRLKEQLNPCVLLGFTSSRFNWQRRGKVINWGRSDLPNQHEVRRIIVNKPEAIRFASDKIKFLSLMEERGLHAPRMLTDEECMSLLQDGKKVLVREPRGFGGRGITVVRSPDAFNGIPRGKFAVRFFPKESEFRVHVWRGEAIGLTQKRARRDTERSETDRLIWNHGNGWIHCREDVVEPDGIRDLAIASVRATGLDFGAVDLMLNKDGVLRVLEVNTAPGVDGQIAEAYVQAIRREYV